LHRISTDGTHNVLDLSSKPIYQISENGDKIYVTCGQGNLYVLDSKAFSVLRKSHLSEKALRCLSINESSNLIAIGDSEHRITVLTLDQGKIISQWTAHENSVFTTLFDNQMLFSGGRDGKIHKWDFLEGESIHSAAAHMSTVNKLVLNPEKSLLASGSRDKSIKIWDCESLELLKVMDRTKEELSHSHSVNTLLWTNDGLYSGSDDKRILHWKVDC